MAMDYFKIALTGENSEMNAQIQYDIAQCYEKIGKDDEAIEEYIKVEYRYPQGKFWVMQSRLKSAELFEKKGDTETALKVYQKLADGGGPEAEKARAKVLELNAASS